MAQDLRVAPEVDMLRRCEDAIGYRFTRPDLLLSALTHASGANTRLSSNERMEFLGDSVLGLVTCEALYTRFPEYQEGDLTKIKSAVVSSKACARFAASLGLGEFLIIGRGMSVTDNSGVPAGMMGDLFESLVAAIYLDGGLEPARTFILAHLLQEIEEVAGGSSINNYKSQLQQTSQREFNSTPMYIMLDEKGPEHSKCFKIAAVIDRYTYPGAWGRTKKEAEQRAAMNALAEIHGDPLPFDHG